MYIHTYILWTLTHVTPACAQGEESHFSRSHNLTENVRGGS